MAESDKLNIDNIIARLLEGKAAHLPSLRGKGGGVIRSELARVTLRYTSLLRVTRSLAISSKGTRFSRYCVLLSPLLFFYLFLICFPLIDYATIFKYN